MKKLMTLLMFLVWGVSFLGRTNDAVAQAVSTTPLSELAVVADADANLNTATNLDIVIIYDRAAVELFPKTAAGWFAQKHELLTAVGRSLDLVSLQVSPGTQMPVRLPPRTRNAVAVYSYANYSSQMGQPVGVLTAFHKMTIHLTSGTVVYTDN